MTIWLGIDPGTLCGYAVVAADGKRLHSGEWNLTRRRLDGPGMVFIRFERLFRELLATVPDAPVAYESVANYHVGSGAVQAGIISHLQRICEEVGRPYGGLSPAEIKKHGTGKGNANKDAMVAAAQERWPELPETVHDNEADACWIADAGRAGLA